MHYIYDNSAANPRNPQQPPIRARWGQRSAEEMGDLWVQVLTNSDRDLEVLSRDFRAKVAAEDVKGYETEIEKRPADAGLHDDVALLYMELGMSDRAIAHFTSALALKPQSPAAHYNLGTAFTVARRLDEAAAEYLAALRLDPSYANAHNNLGNVLLAQKKYDEAIAEFAEVVKLQPDSAAAKQNLAAAKALAERRQ
jgi:tetratricopeptide (TPR) repeat protein